MKKTFVDPAIQQNKKVLKDRETRILQKEAESSLDLGLKVEAPPESDNPLEFLRDEFDRKSFGDTPRVTTRVVYGPDPIVNNCPEFHERLERHGLEAVALAFHDLILKKGEFAAPDSIMQKAIRSAIKKFGKEATAKAFQNRILEIPSRTVEIELDTEIDPLIMNPMRDAVARYGKPGFSVKFLSDRCNTVLGLRGYEVVKAENGDPVKVGTLFMALIPEHVAQRRREHWAQESEDALKEQEASFFEAAAREIRNGAGRSGISASVLNPGESVHANPDVNDEYGGDARETGFRMRRSDGRSD